MAGDAGRELRDCQILVRLTRSEKRRLDHESAITGAPLSEIARRAIDAYLRLSAVCRQGARGDVE